MSSEPAHRVTRPASLLEVRVLEGPNLYFPRAGGQADPRRCPATSTPRRRRCAASRAAIGLRRGQPGRAGLRACASGSLLRRRRAGRARSLAAEVGHPPARRAHPGRQRDRRRRGAPSPGGTAAGAEALGDGGRPRCSTRCPPADRRGCRGRPRPRPSPLRRRARRRPADDHPAHPGRRGDRHQRQDHDHPDARPHRHDAPGCASAGRTDGVYVDGELVEAGDYSGPAGAGARCSRRPRRAARASPRPPAAASCCEGMGVTHNDVSVVTNVSRRPPRPAGHRHRRPARRGQGGRHPDHPAAAAGSVLNGDDPRVLAMRAGIRARPWVFTADPDSPAVREALGAGGRATTVIDG